MGGYGGYGGGFDKGGWGGKGEGYGKGGQGGKGYLPLKSLVPIKMNNKIADWRKWREDTMDFLDSQKVGMRSFLRKMGEPESSGGMERNDPTEGWLKAQEVVYGDYVARDQVQVWRALKGLTEGEAESVVLSVKDQDGWRAWQALHRHFEPSLLAMQGRALTEFSMMINKPARNPEETRKLLVEFEIKLKQLEDISGKAVDEMHSRGILISMLDPLTKQHTAMSQGDGLQAFKAKIQQFVNGTAGGGTTMAVGAMAFGGVGGDGMYYPEGWGWGWGDEEEYGGGDGGVEVENAAALASTVCYGCGQTGHVRANCPSGGGKPWVPSGGKKGFGKGGGFGGKGKGKGFGGKGGFGSKGGKGGKGGFGGGKGGPKGGCFNCGGPHYADQCPNKNPGSLRTLDSWMPEGWTGETGGVSKLCGVSEVAGSQRSAGLSQKKKVESKPTTGPKWFKVLEDVDEEESPVAMVESPPEIQEKRLKKKSLGEAFDKRGKGSCGCESPGCGTRWSRTFDCRTNVAPRSDSGAGIKGESEADGSGTSGGLNILFGVEPEGCNALGSTDGWVKVEFAVDSGATETVMADDMLENVETKAGPASKMGVLYEVANGVRIPNEGEKKFVAYTDENSGGKEVVAQICQVNKALLSVRRMVAAGNMVVFSPEENYIQSTTTGERVELSEREGMYMVDMWVQGNGGF